MSTFIDAKSEDFEDSCFLTPVSYVVGTVFDKLEREGIVESGTFYYQKVEDIHKEGCLLSLDPRETIIWVPKSKRNIQSQIKHKLIIHEEVIIGLWDGESNDYVGDPSGSPARDSSSASPHDQHLPSVDQQERALPQTHNRSSTRSKSLSCSECGKTFRCASEVEIHMRAHTNERPFECGDCGLTFARSWSLKKHRLVHEDTSRHGVISSLEEYWGLLEKKFGRFHDPDNPPCRRFKGKAALTRHQKVSGCLGPATATPPQEHSDLPPNTNPARQGQDTNAITQSADTWEPERVRAPAPTSTPGYEPPPDPGDISSPNRRFATISQSIKISATQDQDEDGTPVSESEESDRYRRRRDTTFPIFEGGFDLPAGYCAPSRGARQWQTPSQALESLGKLQGQAVEVEKQVKVAEKELQKAKKSEIVARINREGKQRDLDEKEKEALRIVEEIKKAASLLPGIMRQGFDK
ncbi:hypothetical protein ACJZ2D_014361 [Fusarium nematophilum]